MSDDTNNLPAVKIVWFSIKNTADGEQRIAELLSQGFRIAAAGGTGGYAAGSDWKDFFQDGFVVMVRD